MSQKTLQYSVLAIKDGGANSIDVKLGDGTISWTQKRPVKYVKNRGLLDTVRIADEEPLEVTLNAVYEWIKGDTGDAVNIYEAITKTGNAAAWASTDTDTCAPYAVDLEITYDPVCTGEKSEVITFPDFRYETIDVDEKEGTFSIKGMCNVTAPTVDRPA